MALRGVRGDGAEFPAEISLSSVALATGRLTVAVVRDVSERVEVESRVRDEAHRREIVAAVLLAEQGERTRIATELHDDTIQVMTAALLTIDRVVMAVGRGRAGSLLKDARRSIEAATERARRLTFELRPAILHERGLRAALTELVDQAGREIGARTTVEVADGRFPRSVEELVYRTAQESVSNVRKHSRASAIEASVVSEPGRLAVRIADDGRGFDPASAGERAGVLHMGIEAMVERVRAAGGQVRIDSAPGRGTTVVFDVPLPDGDPPSRDVGAVRR